MMGDKRGFTLIELLIVIVIIGILAAIAIPKYASTKEKAFVARMTTDLRNLAVSEEAYFDDNAAYYGGAIPAAALVYNPSTGVTITIDNVTDDGWSATARSVGTSRQCMVFYGSAGPDGAATVEAKITCP
jgi:type II secretion system protein G